ncbi:glycoside hydrolase family 113 [Christiangramia salexigens]|uniref:Glycoside hydrolase n=1 Tax=Christiangramia salexigens TaxID=1913577 RepID=A0A1L3J8J8_9FLAO|nr:glycoside hydrolase [Christiangramia salexigens]APG61441.1 glycoside hydrolase [Christiangramia salexigens]
MKPKIYKILILSLASIMFACQGKIPVKKINGVSLVASRDSLKPEQIAPMKKLYSNSVALMPFAFMPNIEEPELYFNNKRQWYGERKEGIKQAIALLQQQKLMIMLKPQIWIRNGHFTGDLKFKKEEDWKKFEQSYRDYLLLFAEVARDHNVEMLCVGTELFHFVNARPQFWEDLISEIREFYKGEIVYAENWDKANKIEIWKQLDYIGVDAYFPLSNEASPGLDELRSGWQPHKQMLRELSRKYNKPVIFTEYGYRSIDYAAREPWNSSREMNSINHKLQADALSALYDEFWSEPWFEGGFIWKWHQHENSGGMENNRFTPQNKPAEEVVKSYYKSFTD